MDELIDIYNGKGVPTGKTCLKSFAHKKGILHASVHIWIFDEQKNVLIQKRTTSKDTFPNLWDVSVAGHISAGENPEQSALREVEEEIGLKVEAAKLNFIGTFKKNIQHSKELIDNEIHYIYMCKMDINLKLIKIQKEEVAAVKLISLNELTKLVFSSESMFVPHGEPYFNMILNELKNS
jgi:isopentenyldiphosphate isomerase